MKQECYLASQEQIIRLLETMLKSHRVFAPIACRRNFSFEEMKNKKATGSTQKGIINETISSIPLIIPDKKLLEEFNSKTITLYKNIYKNQRENYELIQLRNFLLPLLMIGQVKVN